jgi:hypothetical protein
VSCRLRVDASPEPIPRPAERSFTDGSVPVDDVHAVPFALVGDTSRAVVDPVPRAAEEGLVPERTVRPRTDYLAAGVRFPHEGSVAAVPVEPLDDRVHTWLTGRTWPRTPSSASSKPGERRRPRGCSATGCDRDRTPTATWSTWRRPGRRLDSSRSGGESSARRGRSGTGPTAQKRGVRVTKTLSREPANPGA